MFFSQCAIAISSWERTEPCSTRAISEILRNNRFLSGARRINSLMRFSCERTVGDRVRQRWSCFKGRKFKTGTCIMYPSRNEKDEGDWRTGEEGERGGRWRWVGMKFHSRNEIESLITHRYFFARRIARWNDVKPHSPLRYAINGESALRSLSFAEGSYFLVGFSSPSTEKDIALRSLQRDCALRESDKAKWYYALSKTLERKFLSNYD